MIDDKLIEIINNLKNKRLSDIEITDILLQNNYVLDEIKENITHYNQTHGILEPNYVEKYEQIYGQKMTYKKKPSNNAKVIDKNIRTKKTKKETPIIKKEISLKPHRKIKISDLISLLAVLILLAFIVLMAIRYNLIDLIKLPF
jgi:hypothetical protein